MNHWQQIENMAKQVRKWTRFDSQDPSTFPPVGQFLYITEYSGSISYDIGNRVSGESDDDFGYLYFEKYMTHWAPYPTQAK